MHRCDAPAAAVAGANVALIEIGGDRLDPHRAAFAVTVERQPVDQAHCVGVDWIDLQLLFDLRTALLSGHDAITDRRQRAIPIALARILLHSAQGVLGIFLRLVFVEQRHDLTHHHAHRIVAEVLRNGDQTHAILGELADIEFELELIAEKA
jgi:hypothetical protein